MTQSFNDIKNDWREDITNSVEKTIAEYIYETKFWHHTECIFIQQSQSVNQNQVDFVLSQKQRVSYSTLSLWRRK